MKRMTWKTSIACAVALTGWACPAAGLTSGSYVQDGLKVARSGVTIIIR